MRLTMDLELHLKIMKYFKVPLVREGERFLCVYQIKENLYQCPIKYIK